MTKALNELERIAGKRAIITMCCGGGLGTGTLITRDCTYDAARVGRLARAGDSNARGTFIIPLNSFKHGLVARRSPKLTVLEKRGGVRVL